MNESETSDDGTISNQFINSEIDLDQSRFIRYQSNIGSVNRNLTNDNNNNNSTNNAIDVNFQSIRFVTNDSSRSSFDDNHHQLSSTYDLNQETLKILNGSKNNNYYMADLNHQMQQQQQQQSQPSLTCIDNDAINEEMPLSFSNLNINEINHPGDNAPSITADKFWTLDPNINNDFCAGGQPFHPENSNQKSITFTESSLPFGAVTNQQSPQLNQQQPSQQSQTNQKTILYEGSFQSAPKRSTLIHSQQQQQPSNDFLDTDNSVKQTSIQNWPRSAQIQPPSIQSNGLTWSNAFSSAYASIPSGLDSSPNPNSPNIVTTPNNAWNTANVLLDHQKRSPALVANQSILNQNSMTNLMAASNNMKKSSANENSRFITNDPMLKFRRSANPSTFIQSLLMKNSFPPSGPQLVNTGQTNFYELGSAGSDNTSSSSDSANLRENGLFFQEKNFEQNPFINSLRVNLDQQYNDVLNSNPDVSKNLFNYSPLQPNTLQDDKKQLKGRFNRRRGKSPFFTGNDSAEMILNEFPITNNESNERFSRKVFVGGLPPDIDEEEITASFRKFGHLVVDWPHKAESKSYFPPKGYAFLLFQEESSVQMLIDTCIQEDDKLYLCVSSPTMKDKAVQIRPWRLSDADYVLDATMPLDPRKTVFVGGVPRPLKAVELAMIMDRLYGGVCYAGIDTDPELKYPKGAGRVAFSNQKSYIAAISARFVQLQHADIEKRVEVKPYVLDDQVCDECQGVRCNGKYAPYFCANITCLQYYCENCWATIHSRPGREFHKPLVKEGADRPRAVPFRWC
ncbi:F-actin-capping protein subunit alpha [Sarcoptes scabiei]|nr:F-actin-capping protein subunit alpha [Sarcoptes scabiei]